jgi:hypothetical protein
MTARIAGNAMCEFGEIWIERHDAPEVHHQDEAEQRREVRRESARRAARSSRPRCCSARSRRSLSASHCFLVGTSCGFRYDTRKKMMIKATVSQTSSVILVNQYVVVLAPRQDAGQVEVLDARRERNVRCEDRRLTGHRSPFLSGAETAHDEVDTAGDANNRADAGEDALGPDPVVDQPADPTPHQHAPER